VCTDEQELEVRFRMNIFHHDLELVEVTSFGSSLHLARETFIRLAGCGDLWMSLSLLLCRRTPRHHHFLYRIGLTMGAVPSRYILIARLGGVHVMRDTRDNQVTCRDQSLRVGHDLALADALTLESAASIDIIECRDV
jgi:hypothetical protein